MTREPQRVRRQRVKMALAAIGFIFLGFSFAMIWLVSALWQMLFGR